MIRRIKNSYSTHLLGYAEYPFTAFIEVNYDCVLRCKMCQLWTADFKKHRLGDGRVLSREEIQKVIDEFAAVGVKNICFIGGEPFLRKDLLDLIIYCKSRGLGTTTVSNGYLIKEDLARRIVLSGLDILAVSIDGPTSDVHDRIRGVAGAFDHAVNAIKLIREQQKQLNAEHPKVAIACTVSSNNFQVLPDMVDLAKSLDVRQLRFQYISVIDKRTVELTNRTMGDPVISVHNFVGIPPEYLVSESDIEKLQDVLEEIRRRAGAQVDCHFDPAFLENDKSFLKQGIFPVWDCAEPWSRAYMTPTGNFMPCPMFPDFNMGNIRDSSFKDIWNGDRARKIRKRLTRGLPPICQKCCVVHSGKQSTWKKLYRTFAGIHSSSQ